MFDNVTGLQVVHSTGLAEAAEDLEVAELHRTGDGWHIEGHTFDMRFAADCFRQTFRAVPRHGQGQRLSLSGRGGYSFSEQAADL